MTNINIFAPLFDIIRWHNHSQLLESVTFGNLQCPVGRGLAPAAFPNAPQCISLALRANITHA